MAFRVVRQHDERDCGAACLAMIARHHGLRYPISRFRELTKTDQRGVTLYGLVDGAKQLGFDADGLAGTLDELSEALASGEVACPFIAHVRENEMLHYVVVYRVQKHVLNVADPARGHRKLSLDEFDSVWTGYITAFRKTPAFRPGGTKGTGALRFVGLLRGQYLRLATVLLMSLAIAGIGIAGAFSFKLVMDNYALPPAGSPAGSEGASPNGVVALVETAAGEIAVSPLVVIFGSLLLLYMVNAVIQFARGYLIIAISAQIDIRLLPSYFDHIVDLPVSSVNLRKTGEYLSRFSDAAAIRAAISGAAISLLLDATMVVGVGVVLYLQSGPLFWVALSIVVLYVIVLLVYRRPIERSSRAVMESNAVLQSFLKESIDGVETIKAADAGDQIQSKARRKIEGFIASVVKAGRIEVTQDTISETVQTIGTVIILWLGFALVARNAITVGTLITFYALLALFVQPVRNLVDLQPAIQTAMVAADRLNDVLDLRPEETQPDTIALGRVEVWELKDVEFRYGHRAPALRGVSLRVGRGERIAIVGESGSGKTTLVKLMLRFYEPGKGQLLANDVPLSSVGLSELRNSIAYVDQNTYLFSDSIRNNLRLGNAAVSDRDIEDACRACRADDFIAALPLGYDTPLDENGMNLSGGQRQRLAIARALLRKPQLLILDEATSNLDTVTESGIRSAVAELDDELAVILIAHRLTTVQDTDRIYVMASGEIAEEGAHQELLAARGRYFELWKGQGLKAVQL